jgi:RHS repeat-associated protein
MPVLDRSDTRRPSGAAAWEYNRARWYDPRVGRWTSQDPLGLVPDANPYRYVGSNPLGATDPLGMADKGWGFWVQDKKGPPNWEVKGETRKTPNNAGASLTVEGPYYRTTKEYGAFKMTIEYKTLDKKPVPPSPPKPKKPIVTSNEHYGNSGVYIFNRYEAQIVDPSAWGVKRGGKVENHEKDGKKLSDRNKLLPGGVYGIDPPGGKFINQAKATGEWNKLEIDFRPPYEDEKKKGVWHAARITTKLNGETVWQGPILIDGKPARGTGSRKDREGYVTKGYIYLQSHWGSQVEFRNPVIDPK